MSVIPIVDLGELGVGNTEVEPSEVEWQRVSSEIKSAFADIGFVYLANHGIPGDMIHEVFAASENFFGLDATIKTKYTRGVTDIQGYTGPDQERLSENQGVHELRESYDIHTIEGKFPDNEVDSLRPAVKGLMEHCRTLTFRLLTALAIALDLERSYFLKRHRGLTSKDNASSMRILYYPACLQDPKEKDDSIATRCGAHTDYGTVTLLFQDKSGGLEVKERGGNWVHALPIPDTILVNAGDILQFWTANRFRATEHRVQINESASKVRQSVVFFVHPDDDVVVVPYDGSASYLPVLAKEYTLKRFAETYKI